MWKSSQNFVACNTSVIQNVQALKALWCKLLFFLVKVYWWSFKMASISSLQWHCTRTACRLDNMLLVVHLYPAYKISLSHRAFMHVILETGACLHMHMHMSLVHNIFLNVEIFNLFLQTTTFCEEKWRIF